MAWGKTDKEKELEAQELALQKQASDLKMKEENIKHERELLNAAKAAFEQEREDFRKDVEQTNKQIAKDQADLEKRRQEVVKKETEAQAGFVAIQQTSFDEIIANLEDRKKELAAISKKTQDELVNVIAREGAVASRELAVTEREQTVNAGCPDKVTELAEEAKRQHEANLQFAEQLKNREGDLDLKLKAFEAEKEELRKREQAVVDAERLRDAGYSDERSNLTKELKKKEAEQLAALEVEIAELRKTRIDAIKDSENNERDRIRKEADDYARQVRADVNQERADWNQEREKQKAELKKQSEANEKKAGDLSAKEDSLLYKEQELQMRECNLENQFNSFQDTVDDCVAERIKTLEKEKAAIQEENNGLRNKNRDLGRICNLYDQLKRQLNGDEPSKVKQELDAKDNEIHRLRELLSNPPAEIQEELDELKKERNRYKEKAERLQDELEKSKELAEQSDELRRKNNKLEQANNDIKQEKKDAEARANKYKADYERTLAAYKNPQAKEDRYKAIKEVRIPADKFTRPKKRSVDEIEWLTGIGKACDDYGIHFPERILKAFHTAIKTAEWSPITILAGVSGTGKSELPRLYSHFGGLFFEPVTVQPNWDSQESMLGFFNSIDNFFDAQPVLRFLAQSQEGYSENYPGLNEGVCMVLLDEMNLAHPELYFAEFLSKLEQRRGMEPDVLPKLEVKVGARIEPYPLPLGRNVLWTGTMNQDETTKSLSDKVLDRSIIIYFPRPTELKPRPDLQALNKDNRGEILHLKDFRRWIVNNTAKVFKDEKLILPYRKFVEEINNYLGKANRAVGHRVWQSIEYYMANYPDVRNAKNDSELKRAMHIAFEDQLVQKVMPKLRGIETRANSTIYKECIEPIRNLLDTGVNQKGFNLMEDFGLACKLGHGQFIWMSADYINKAEEGQS